MKKTSMDKRLYATKKMPPLRHSMPGKRFDIIHSEVAQWLCTQPSIMQYVFDKISSYSGEKQLIRYDPQSGMWQGVDSVD